MRSPPDQKGRAGNRSSLSSSTERLLSRILAGHLLELLDRLLLGLRELLRHREVHARDQIAPPRALELRRAAALDAQELAVLGAGRDLEGHLAVRSRHLDGGPERGLGERDRHVDLEVRITAAPEE